MSKNRKKTLVWAVVGVGALALVVLGVINVVTKKIPVNGAEVIRGPIKAYVEERGRTTLPHMYHITMPIQGSILPIDIEEGDLVESGQVVARVDDVDWVDNAAQVKNIVVAVQRWVEAVEAQVKAGQIRYDYTKWEWEANQELMKSSFISERTGRESKRWYLDSSVKIEEADSMYHMSKAVQEMVALIPSFVARNIEKTHVKSPVSGSVLKRYVWNEKVMNPGEPLLDIGNMEELEVTAEILTEEAVRVNSGDRVEIFGEAVGHEQIYGEVRRIEPEAFTKISSLGVEEQRVAVNIRFAENTITQLKEKGRVLGLQYRVRVRIITDEKKSTLVVPRTALFHGMNGGWQLFRIIGGKATITDVKVGLLNDYSAEIISGVESGDAVIIAPESSISEGTRVVME